MIDSRGWVDFAIRYDDPTPSVNPGVNEAAGCVLHSADGYEAGLVSVLNASAVSWHFSNLKDGRLWQHYPLTARCWHSASSIGNQHRIGIEHEGIPGEPLTEAQLDNTVRLIKEISKAKGWTPTRGLNLHEHRELSATQCPSGRIPWPEILRRLEPEEDYGPMKLNEDGSQRIESRGNQIVIVNGGVDVLVIGDESGGLRGQVKKLFGPAYYWLRSNLKTGRAYWSKTEGD